MIKVVKRRILKSIKIDQGDIYNDITFFRNVTTKKGALKFDYWEFPKVLVLSQTCDLHREQENKPSEYSGKILSVLVVPLFKLTEYHNGVHLLGIGIEENKKTTRDIEKLKKDEIERCFLIDLDREQIIKNKLEDSYVIDFRYFFTADLSQFSSKKYVTSVQTVYREKISQKFSNYLSRIGLPDQKAKDNADVN